LTFYVYGAENVESARAVVRADKYNRKAMTESNIDYETVELHVIRCTATGEVGDSDIPAELDIMMKENAELDRLYNIWRKSRHPQLESHNEY